MIFERISLSLIIDSEGAKQINMIFHRTDGLPCSSFNDIETFELGFNVDTSADNEDLIIMLSN